MSESLSLAVVIASAGRPELLTEVLGSLAAQDGIAFQVVVTVPDESSLPRDSTMLDGIRVVTGKRGASAQRNAGLDSLENVDVVAFFDDDSVLRPDWLRRAVDFLAQNRSVVGLTGKVVLDGAVSGEIPRDVAARALEISAAQPVSGMWRLWSELYGCNFAYRMDRAPHLRFDERLPLYSWLEDHDFARRLMRIGDLAKVDDCVIVHRAAASGGRQSHVRLGYSQVMNPVYLYTKGSFTLALALTHFGRRVAKNVALSFFGSARHLRRERLHGNALALHDIARRRITPERILDLS